MFSAPGGKYRIQVLWIKGNGGRGETWLPNLSQDISRITCLAMGISADMLRI